MLLIDRFLKYILIETKSNPESTSFPTTETQFNLAKILVEDLKEIGVLDAFVDENCYVYGHVPGTSGFENEPSLGFIAHVDTSPDFTATGLKPRIIENYDGKDITLGDSGRTITLKDFPHLTNCIGKTIICTDGNTLLGADDKAGVTEIICAVEEIIKNNIPHGPISICFTPDEEVGQGADRFNLEVFNAQTAYTVDGSEPNLINYENFNAAAAKFEITGVVVHPGSAKNIMVNASLVAMEINSLLPPKNTPRDTEGYEGFYHLIGINGDDSKCTLSYIVRDFDKEAFEKRQEILQKIADEMNKKYGKNTVKLTMREQYLNMASVIEKYPFVIEIAKNAIKSVGLTPGSEPIRGGTDGARLSFMGLPCPNLGTGGYGYHGPLEHAVLEEMLAAKDIIVNIIKK